MIKHHCDICDYTIGDKSDLNQIPSRPELNEGGQELCTFCFCEISRAIKLLQTTNTKSFQIQHNTNRNKNHVFTQFRFIRKIET